MQPSDYREEGSGTCLSEPEPVVQKKGEGSNEFVTLEQAKRLAARGFPPTYPGMAYVPCAVTGGDSCLAYAHVIPETTAVYAYCGHGGKGYSADTLLAAPDYLKALIWLEETQDIPWGHAPQLGWYLLDGDTEMLSWDKVHEYGGPSELLDSILSRIEAAAPVSASGLLDLILKVQEAPALDHTFVVGSSEDPDCCATCGETEKGHGGRQGGLAW